MRQTAGRHVLLLVLFVAVSNVASIARAQCAGNSLQAPEENVAPIQTPAFEMDPILFVAVPVLLPFAFPSIAVIVLVVTFGVLRLRRLVMKRRERAFVASRLATV